MKISVITGKGGALVATLGHDDDASKKGSPKAGFILGRGQTLHELDLPAELEGVKSAEELHRALPSGWMRPSGCGG